MRKSLLFNQYIFIFLTIKDKTINEPKYITIRI